MRTGIIITIVAILLIIPMQLILPFPYGLVAMLFLVILGIVSAYNQRKPSKIPGRTQTDDTMFFGCPHCGGNTQIVSERQYYTVCRIYL